MCPDLDIDRKVPGWTDAGIVRLGLPRVVRPSGDASNLLAVRCREPAGRAGAKLTTGDRAVRRSYGVGGRATAPRLGIAQTAWSDRSVSGVIALPPSSDGAASPEVHAFMLMMTRRDYLPGDPEGFDPCCSHDHVSPI